MALPFLPFSLVSVLQAECGGLPEAPQPALLSPSLPLPLLAFLVALLGFWLLWKMRNGQRYAITFPVNIFQNITPGTHIYLSLHLMLCWQKGSQEKILYIGQTMDFIRL